MKPLTSERNVFFLFLLTLVSNHICNYSRCMWDSHLLKTTPGLSSPKPAGPPFRCYFGGGFALRHSYFSSNELAFYLFHQVVLYRKSVLLRLNISVTIFLGLTRLSSTLFKFFLYRKPWTEKHHMLCILWYVTA